MLTIVRVRELFDYDAERGFLTWKVCRGPNLVGASFGCHDYKGYVRGGVDGCPYFAHRLVWFYVYGKWPKYQIDHINGIKDDNRIINLREATPSENKRNQPVRRDSGSGVKGVHLDKRTNRWRAKISDGGKRINLGFYSTKAEATFARRSAGERLHGLFAREG